VLAFFLGKQGAGLNSLYDIKPIGSRSPPAQKLKPIGGVLRYARRHLAAIGRVLIMILQVSQ
jgi:hypothetical protein